MSNHHEMLIGGNFIGGPCDQSTPKGVAVNPWDQSTLGTYAEGTLEHLSHAIGAADEAFRTWRFSTRQERSNLLRRIADSVIDRKAELADLLVREIGKPILWAEGEVNRLALTFQLAADLATTFGESSEPVDFDPRGAGYRAFVQRVPIGVIFGLVPYNWPFNLAAHKIAPALATGNTIVVKPNPLSAMSTLALGRLIHEAGCPDGVVNVVPSGPHDTETALKDPRIAMISFTGSESVGWSIAEKAPANCKVTLELGGDAFAIVCADADIEAAAARIRDGGYGYAGQICISIQHVLVEHSIYPTFCSALQSLTENCKVGDPSLRETICGPMIDAKNAQRLKSWIEEAVDKGAKVLAGGNVERNRMSPTLITNLPADCRLSTEEAFGPILTIAPFAEFSDAIQRVNRSRFGIQLGVFTGDITRAESAFRDAEVGGVIIGDYPTLRFDNLPYGGVKRSGIGREGVAYAMEEMTTPKLLLTKTKS